jgi:hypothetical protein
MPRSRLGSQLAVQSPHVVLDAIFEELQSGRAWTDAGRIALLLEARILLFREKERIQRLEAPAAQKPTTPVPPLEDVDLAVLRLQAQLLAAELKERFPKQQSEAAGITFFAPNTRSNPSEQTLKLKKTDTVDLVRVFQDVLARIRSRPKPQE